MGMTTTAWIARWQRINIDATQPNANTQHHQQHQLQQQHHRHQQQVQPRHGNTTIVTQTCTSMTTNKLQRYSGVWPAGEDPLKIKYLP